MVILPIQSFLDHFSDHFLGQLWKFLHHHEFQKFTCCLASKESLFILDTYFGSTRKRTFEVIALIIRLIWGFLFSRVGFKTLFCVAASMNLSSFVVIIATNNETAYIIFYTLNSIALGGMMVIFPNVSLVIFGKRIGDNVYSYYWLAFSLSNFFQFAITLVLTNNPITSDDYSEVLLFFAFCVLGAFFICIR